MCFDELSLRFILMYQFFKAIITLSSSKHFSICQRPHCEQIAHLGDDDDEPEFSSAMPLEEGDTFFFAPRPLRNLVLVGYWFTQFVSEF